MVVALVVAVEPNTAAAVGLDDAPGTVGQDVEADRLAQVRGCGHERLLVVGTDARAAVAVDRVGLTGGPLDRANEFLDEVRVAPGG